MASFEADRQALISLIGVEEKVVGRGLPGYDDLMEQQYAYSSHRDDMAPLFIIKPQNEEDIIQVLRFAAEKNYRVAVRPGGHQYSGASSVSPKHAGILLDLEWTFREFSPSDDGLITMGISFALIDVNQRLKELNLFVPHGQCAHVHVGGHAHTGGYGNSCRGFGLFGDHIMAIKIITADGHCRWIERGTTDKDESELFWAVLGGSPGNFAILTHIKLQAHNSAHHPHARGLRLVVPYTTRVARALLQVKADMASDSNLPEWRCNKELPPDFDMCITVLSVDMAGYDLPAVAMKVFGRLQKAAKAVLGGDDDSPTPETSDDDQAESGQSFYEKIGLLKQDFDEFKTKLENRLREDASHGFLRPLAIEKPAFIVVWAQWSNVNGLPESQQEVPPGPWFDAIRFAAGATSSRSVKIEQNWTKGDAKQEGLSFLTGQWTWPIKREFVWPYDKRTYCTNSTTLNTSGWVKDMTDRMEAALSLPSYLKGLRLAMQVFHFGGPQAAFITNKQKLDTAYSWRDDTTVQLVMDCFHLPRAKGLARQWQEQNDVVFKGPNSGFAPGMDRRVLWGSYAGNEAEKSLDAAWRFYFEDEAKYKKLQRIKQRVDPDNLLTPNDFAIHAPPKVPAA